MEAWAAELFDLIGDAVFVCWGVHQNLSFCREIPVSFCTHLLYHVHHVDDIAGIQQGTEPDGRASHADKAFKQSFPIDDDEDVRETERGDAISWGGECFCDDGNAQIAQDNHRYVLSRARQSRGSGRRNRGNAAAHHRRDRLRASTLTHPRRDRLAPRYSFEDAVSCQREV